MGYEYLNVPNAHLFTEEELKAHSTGELVLRSYQMHYDAPIRQTPVNDNWIEKYRGSDGSLPPVLRGGSLDWDQASEPYQSGPSRDVMAAYLGRVEQQRQSQLDDPNILEIREQGNCEMTRWKIPRGG